MRLIHFFISCCLLASSLVVNAQEDGSVSGIISTIPSRVIGGIRSSINKQIEIEAKDIIVNIGKVNIEIEKNFPPRVGSGYEGHQGRVGYDGHQGGYDGSKHQGGQEEGGYAPEYPVHQPIREPNNKHVLKPTTKPISSQPIKPIKKPGTVYEDTTAPVTTPAASAEDTSIDLPEFEEFEPSAEPSADETILGENATAITVQGGEQFTQDGILILTGPQIFSVTFKIVKEKIINIVSSDGLGTEFGINEAPAADVNVSGVDTTTSGITSIRPPREAVTFIIRGRGFTPGGTLFPELSDFVEGGGQQRGLFNILEPQVFLGAIPLKVVRFTDTVILARFLDVEEQRSFQAGTFLARVKVIHIDLRREQKKKGPEGFGIAGIEEGPLSGISGIGGVALVPNGFPAVIAALSQRRTFVPTDGLITSPVLGVIGTGVMDGKKQGFPGIDGVGIDGKNRVDGLGTSSLLGLFAGLRFDTAVLTVQFSEEDARKIRGAFNTLFTDGSLFPEDL